MSIQRPMKVKKGCAAWLRFVLHMVNGCKNPSSSVASTRHSSKNSNIYYERSSIRRKTASASTCYKGAENASFGCTASITMSISTNRWCCNMEKRRLSFSSTSWNILILFFRPVAEEDESADGAQSNHEALDSAASDTAAEEMMEALAVEKLSQIPMKNNG